MQEIINLIKESEVGSHQRSYQVKQLELYIKSELDYFYNYPTMEVKNIINKLRNASDSRQISYWSQGLYKAIKSNKQRLDKNERIREQISNGNH